MATLATPAPAVMTTADGVPLRRSLARVQRRRQLGALLLVLPLLLFVLLTFLLPILEMSWRSVDNPQVATILPRTTAALRGWDGQALPDEAAFAALAADVKEAAESRELGKVATRLNYESSGMRSLFNKMGRRADDLAPPFKEALIDVDKDWGELATWQLIQRESFPYTPSYYLAAVDRRIDESGAIVQVPEDERIYLTLFWRTFWMSGLIMLLTLFLGYPVAHLLATIPLRQANLLLILVLLPFWTSLLVRTTAWIAMLQQQGVLNDLLVWLGLIGTDGRLALMHNATGTVIAMTHILLPFMILPLYSVMRTISPSYMRAALSLGARPTTAFVRVYMPLTMPGVGAGGLLVFILAIGYYITPALVGGTSGQLISNMIAYHMQKSLNWGLAGALGVLLLVAVLALYWLYNRLVGIDKMKLG